MNTDRESPLPPETWVPARRIAQAVLGPIDRFLRIEVASGAILLGAAVVALTWANSPWHESYDSLWHTPFSIGLGQWSIQGSVHFWISDLLMAIFFLVVGLEIKREMFEGALSGFKKAALPVAAALGGMVVPAAIYFLFNTGMPARNGWGVPMATDIAFAVGVMSLLGKRVPVSLRVLLLALAIIDDIGAILVIAVFYSTQLEFAGLYYVAGGLFGIVALYKMGIRPGFIYLVPGLVVWGGMLKLGVHPAIAGVMIGFMTPVKSWFSREKFLKVARDAIDEFDDRSDRGLRGHDLIEPLVKLARARREAVSPSVRMEAALHPWVAFVIMPLFALANAGVNVRGIEFGDSTSVAIIAGVAGGLVLGKPIGVLLVSWIAVRLGLCVLPAGVNWRGLLVVGAVAGIGFTMSIFIGELAFQGDAAPLSEIAKLGVLVGSAVAAVGGLLLGRFLLQPEDVPKLRAMTASDVERSTGYWTTGH